MIQRVESMKHQMMVRRKISLKARSWLERARCRQRALVKAAELTGMCERYWISSSETLAAYRDSPARPYVGET